jgi:outer membrane protein assembly factor BamB
MQKAALFLFFLLPVVVVAQSNQWRGPARDGHFPDTELLETWPKGGPELILQVSGIGEGFSSPVKHRGVYYVTGKKDTMDLVSAVNAKGEIKWQVPFGRSWIRSYPNTRSTPTLEGDRIYLQSGTGRLVCLDIERAEEIWTVEVDKDFKADWHKWGVSESPLIVDNLVVVTPSGKRTTMVAFNKDNGELVWKTKATGGKRSYVSPVLYEYNGLRLILGMTTRDVFAVDPANGEIYWKFRYSLLGEDEDREDAIMTNSPIYREDEIFITTGYDFPSVMLKISKDGRSVIEKWRNTTLDNHHGHVVSVGDYIYGANWMGNSNGKWVCLDWETGEVMWETKWNNKGSIITADDLLFIYEEKRGNVGLLKPNPERFELSGSFRITEGEGPHWAHPTIFERELILRHGDYMFVYDVRK